MTNQDKNKTRSFGLKALHSDQSGNVALMTALCMTVLVGTLAFVLGTGHLYGEKNRCQNAVEAAAMAGALQLCGQDPQGVAREVLLQNLLPNGYEGEGLPEGYTVDIVRGYYDESGEEDFSESSQFGYVSFIEAERMPSEVYVNSLLVSLKVNHGIALSGFLGTEEASIQAVAVAYLKRYGLLSLGQDAGDGVFTASRWASGYPRFENMGTIHANKDVDFSGGPPAQRAPILNEHTRVTAVGDIINCPEGHPGADAVFYSRSVDEEIARLRQEAERTGAVVRLSDFPAHNPSIPLTERRVSAPNNNYYYRYNESGFFFGLHDGDHRGIVYYITNQGARPGDFVVLRGTHEQNPTRATNFTVASDVPINFSPGIGGLYLGGENEEGVYVVCSEDIGALQPSLSGTYFRGVVFRTKKRFRMASREFSTTPAIQLVRVIADRGIIVEGHSVPQSTVFEGSFGPPCPPAIVKLGRLSSKP